MRAMLGVYLALAQKTKSLSNNYIYHTYQKSTLMHSLVMTDLVISGEGLMTLD